MNELMNKWSVQVLGMLAITAATTTVFWIAQGSDAQGDPNEVLNWLCAIFGATFVVAIVVLARRG